jgi:hypothetical protein
MVDFRKLLEEGKRMRAEKEAEEEKPRAYYAHCIGIYDTQQEERDIKTIEGLGFRVYNPNCDACSRGYRNRGMDFFKDLIQASRFSVFFFRALPDGSIPAGISAEIGFAQEVNIPVVELPSCISRRTITVEQTREYLKESGAR